MRKLLPCFCLILLCAGASLAQNGDYPKWDFTAAYTYNRFETPPPQVNQNFHGFTGAIGWNFRRWAALEGDVTYTTGTVAGIRRSLTTFIAGPRFTKRKSVAQPFVHALVGGGHLSNFGGGTNGWAGKFGGGLDLVAGKHAAVRIFQVDYYRYHGHVNVGTQRLNNVALTIGIRFF